MTARISASSYSNTAPLIWSFLYGANHGRYELILDNEPTRSFELLSQERVNAALVPVIAFQLLEGIRLIPDVCIGAKEKVRSVCLITKDKDLNEVKTVSLDTSSKTSVCLTKIIFREFLGFEPVWKDAAPDLQRMLAESDCALLIGDPVLRVSDMRGRNATVIERVSSPASSKNYRTLDLAELWRHYTGLGFVFAMWMTRKKSCEIDFAAARNDGILHLDEIISTYMAKLGLSREVLLNYLSENISYSIDDSMQKGMELFFELAGKHRLIETNKPLVFTDR